MDNKKIIVDFKKIYKNKIVTSKYLNENINECLICYNILDDEGLILINNFCECYQIIFICDKCFLRWYNDVNKCFICRSEYSTSDGNKNRIYMINPLISSKLNIGLSIIERLERANRTISNRSPNQSRRSHIVPISTSNEIIAINDIIPRDDMRMYREEHIAYRQHQRITQREQRITQRNQITQHNQIISNQRKCLNLLLFFALATIMGCGLYLLNILLFK